MWWWWSRSEGGELELSTILLTPEVNYTHCIKIIGTEEIERENRVQGSK